jgi:hypothetical protein
MFYFEFERNCGASQSDELDAGRKYDRDPRSGILPNPDPGVNKTLDSEISLCVLDPASSKFRIQIWIRLSIQIQDSNPRLNQDCFAVIKRRLIGLRKSHTCSYRKWIKTYREYRQVW